mmetsp:Transcript_74080/g.163809  ORF Transcript_74080/g.163809 Transcript_74080/m.163809 type:complete len:316 (-) Transcript_74080:50-997(-)
MQVEDCTDRERGPEQVARRAVGHSLRLSSGTRSVQHEEIVLRVHFLNRAIRPHPCCRFHQPDVAPRLHKETLHAGPLQDKASGDEVALRHRLIDDLLQWDDLLPTKALVRSADHWAPGIENAIPEGGGREACEDHGVHSPDACRREHAISGFGNHGHVDGDAISFPEAVELVEVCDSARLLQELLEGDLFHICGLVTLVNNRGAVRSHLGPTVNTIVADVDFAAREPTHVALLHILVDYLLEWLHPSQKLGLLCPEFLALGANGSLVHGLILLLAGNMAPVAPCRRVVLLIYRQALLLHHIFRHLAGGSARAHAP